MLFILLLPLLLLAEVPDIHAERSARYKARYQMPGYECKRPNGYEAVTGKCDEFVECENDIAVQHTCPDGLHFNYKAQWPKYPCGYPSEVKCSNSDVSQQPQPNGECSHRYGFFRTPNSDCKKYILCHAGVAQTMECPFGLVFNSIKSICDWPANVPNCDLPAELNQYTCPLPTAEEDQEPIYNYGDSCERFIACVDGSPRLLRCDQGFYFDKNAMKCKESKYVKDCTPDI